MRRILYGIVAVCAAATALAAQASSAPTTKIELRPFFGASIPTGDQRDLYGEEPIFGLQSALELKPTFHVVGSFGWVPSKTTYAVGDTDVDIFQYDVGVEFSLVRPMASGWEFRPFLGLGAGGRSYAFAASQLNDETCLSGYGALGSELQMGRTAIRFEARDNVFCYKSPITGIESETRNDVGLALGLAYHFR